MWITHSAGIFSKNAIIFPSEENIAWLSASLILTVFGYPTRSACETFSQIILPHY